MNNMCLDTSPARAGNMFTDCPDQLPSVHRFNLPFDSIPMKLRNFLLVSTGGQFPPGKIPHLRKVTTENKYHKSKKMFSVPCTFPKPVSTLLSDCTGGWSLTNFRMLWPWGWYSQESRVGVCGPLPKTLTIFMTKICNFCYAIYDLARNSI